MDIKKKLEEVQQEHDKHVQNLQQLKAAEERCIAMINALKGKIEVLKELLEEKQ